MSIRRPPLQPLAFFEAAGRHLNFSAAARELGVTQSAVSHQVAWLRADLGVPLFRRLHRGVALTAEGGRLFEWCAGAWTRSAPCWPRSGPDRAAGS